MQNNFLPYRNFLSDLSDTTIYPIAFLQVNLTWVTLHHHKILKYWKDEFRTFKCILPLWIKPTKQLAYSDIRTSNNSYSIYLPEEEYRVPYTPIGYHVSNCWSLTQNSFKNRFYDRYISSYWKSWWNSFTVLRSLSVLLQPHLHKSFLKVPILEVSSFYSYFTRKRTSADLRTTNSTPNTSVSFL